MESINTTFENLQPRQLRLEEDCDGCSIYCMINDKEYEVVIPNPWVVEQGFVFILFAEGVLPIGCMLTWPGETKARFKATASDDPALVVIARRWWDWVRSDREGVMADPNVITARSVHTNLVELTTSKTWPAPAWAKKALGGK